MIMEMDKKIDINTRIAIGVINWFFNLKWYQNILMNLFVPIWYSRKTNTVIISLIPITIIAFVIILILL